MADLRFEIFKKKHSRAQNQSLVLQGISAISAFSRPENDEHPCHNCSFHHDDPPTSTLPCTFHRMTIDDLHGEIELNSRYYE